MAVTEAPAPISPWEATRRDLVNGWRQRELWAHLGWQDIRQRYRRSVLGPIWITISMAVTGIGLGLLYAGLFGNPIDVQLPHILTGFIIWTFISGCLLEGAEVFVANEGLIKFLPAPISVHVYRLVWRQTLLFAHNLIVYVVMLVIFPKPLGWGSLMALPAFGLLVLNGAWAAMFLGMAAARFRDLTPIIGSVVQLVFFVTPIVWIYEDFLNSANPAIASRARWAEVNPMLHFVEIVRRPMLGQSNVWHSWVIVLAITVVGWTVTLLAMRRYRARVAYWV